MSLLETSSALPNRTRLDFPAPIGQTARVSITARQFEEMKGRLAQKRRVAAPVIEPSLRPVARPQQILIGIDPSLRGTGYGVIHHVKSASRACAHGTIHCPAGWERSRCLFRIYQTLRDVIREHQPTVCVVEGLFFAQNLQTAMLMGEARGAALVAAAEAGLEVYEISPRKVKQAIVGYGGAQKLAVARMVQRLLQLAEPPAPDAADALALALTHAQEQSRYSLTPLRRI